MGLGVEPAFQLRAQTLTLGRGCTARDSDLSATTFVPGSAGLPSASPARLQRHPASPSASPARLQRHPASPSASPARLQRHPAWLSGSPARLQRQPALPSASPTEPWSAKARAGVRTARVSPIQGRGGSSPRARRLLATTSASVCLSRIQHVSGFGRDYKLEFGNVTSDEGAKRAGTRPCSGGQGWVKLESLICHCGRYERMLGLAHSTSDCGRNGLHLGPSPLLPAWRRSHRSIRALGRRRLETLRVVAQYSRDPAANRISSTSSSAGPIRKPRTSCTQSPFVTSLLTIKTPSGRE